jgi:hypothetical protein
VKKFASKQGANVLCEPLPASTNHGPHCAACGCKCRTAHGSSTPDLHSMLGPMLESLRSDLQKFFVSQPEEVLRPLRTEASTIKLWFAVLQLQHYFLLARLSRIPRFMVRR